MHSDDDTEQEDEAGGGDQGAEVEVAQGQPARKMPKGPFTVKDFPNPYPGLEAYVSNWRDPYPSQSSYVARGEYHGTYDCKVCHTKISGSYSSSGNMKRHFKHKHPNKLAAFIEAIKVSLNKRKQEKKQKGVKREAEDVKVKDENVAKGEAAPPPLKKSKSGSSVQLTVDDSMMRAKSTKRAMDKALAVMLVRDLLPFRFVEGPGFTAFMKVARPDYKIPSRRTVIRRLDEIYLLAFAELKELISQAAYTCSTADLWSALRRGFLGCTIHWLDGNFERQCLVLVVEETAERHTGKKLAKYLHDIFKRFGVNVSRMTSCITDNGKNITCAFKYNQFQLSALEDVVPAPADPEAEAEEVRRDTEEDEADAVLAGQVLDVGDLLDEYHAEAVMEPEDTTVRLPPVSVVFLFGVLSLTLEFCLVL